MAARFSHRTYRHRDGTIDITVTPNDGRYAETFRATPEEARRFAWALLADFDPAEAAAAAADEGRDLEALTRGADIIYRRFGPGREGASTKAYGPPRDGTKKQRILHLLREGPHTVAGLAGRMPDCMHPGALLYELRGSGYVQRSRRHRFWEITPAGELAIGSSRQLEAS